MIEQSKYAYTGVEGTCQYETLPNTFIKLKGIYSYRYVSGGGGAAIIAQLK